MVFKLVIEQCRDSCPTRLYLILNLVFLLVIINYTSIPSHAILKL